MNLSNFNRLHKSKTDREESRERRLMRQRKRERAAKKINNREDRR